MTLLADFMGRALSPFAGAMSSERCLLPYYHMVSDAYVPHVSPLYRFRSVAEFKRDVDYFLKERRPVSLDEFVQALDYSGAPPAKSFLLTFDDGFREMADIVAPILQAKGVPALFFLISGSIDNRALCLDQKVSLILDRRRRSLPHFPDGEIQSCLRSLGIQDTDVSVGLRRLRWKDRHVADALGHIAEVDFDVYARREQPFLTSSQVQNLLQRGFDVGAHSINHPRYADIPLGEQLRQTRESIDYIAQQFKPRHRAFAFPHTDRGVSRRFFTEAFRENQIAVSFGTAAPARDEVPRSFQRFSMEKTPAKAAGIVGRNVIRKLRLRATGGMALRRADDGIARLN